MAVVGPLQGLRVLELATGVAGPYAGRLLTMLGATVVKVEPDGGDPGRRLPVDDHPPVGTSPLFVHLNGGKRLVHAAGIDLPAAAAWADVVVTDAVLARLGGTPFAPGTARSGDRPGVVATVTAWGAQADDPGRPEDELLVQAASGVMAATAGDDGVPHRFPGWQSQYLAGAYTAAAALAVLGEEPTGQWRHVDVAWLDSAVTGVEAGLCAHLQRASGGGDDDSDRQAGIQAAAFPAGTFRCADGHVVPGTVRPVDWQLQCAVYDRPDLLHDPRFDWAGRWTNREALRAELEPWYAVRQKREIFLAALEAGWAAAMVLTAGDALDDAHLAERRFLSSVHGAASGVVPGRPWRAASMAEGTPVLLAAAGADTDWFRTETASPAGGTAAHRAPAPPAATRLRVLSLTWAWAGPFVGRFLGSIGADVVRIETGSRPDAWRTRLRWRDTGVTVPAGEDPDGHTWDAAALFNSLNRSTRSASVDLSHAEGRAVFMELLSVADGLVVNMGATMLVDRDLAEPVAAAVARGLVAVVMPALGASGPYRAMNGYGTLMEAMGGFAARFGRPHDGAAVTGTYYPDAVAGVHATVALLAGLAERSRTGRGSLIDLSQQETTWLQLGEGLALRSMEGRDPERMGDREPGVDGSGIEPVPGGGWLAVTGARTERVRTWDDLFAGGLLDGRGMLEWLDHPVTGRRAYLGSPVRIDGQPVRSTRAAPMFDEHTDEVLAGWADIGPERLGALRAADAIGTRPRSSRRTGSPAAR